MPVQRRKDTGAWEVVVPRPGMAPIRRSSARWTHADALAYERKLTSNHHTLEDGLDKWLVEYAHYLRARKSLESAANLLRPFIKNKTFEDVPELVGVLRRAWSELQPATINRRMAILRRVCNLAYKEWRWIDTPVAGTVRPLRENNERHYYLTRAEVERLRMNCTVYGAGELIVLAAFTGLRLGEILGIRPGDVRDHSLHLRKTKNGRPTRGAATSPCRGHRCQAPTARRHSSRAWRCRGQRSTHPRMGLWHAIRHQAGRAPYRALLRPARLAGSASPA